MIRKQSTESPTLLEKRFIRVAHIEGVSYLLLLFVAVPLKYFANIPDAVKYAGWIHGFLFVAFCLFLPFLLWSAKWKFLRVVRAFILSLLPFGTFMKL